MRKLTNNEFIKKCAKLKPNIEILEKYINERTNVHVKCKICDYDWYVRPTSLMYLDIGCPNCSGCVKITLDDFINQLNIFSHFHILDASNFKNTKSLIKIKCDKCGGIFSSSYNSLIISKTNCPFCTNKKVLKGFNDMWTINPELAKLLANPEDGYKYTQGSSVKVDWKCPNCNNIIKSKQISEINRNGLSCPRCSDGFSFPEKIIYNMLLKLDIEFKYQYHPNWCKYQYQSKNKIGIYDFYIPSKRLIIETDGGIGHGHNNKFQSDSKESIEIDNIKDNLAIKHGIKVIRIDCDYNNFENRFEYIKSNILKSIIPKLFNISNIDWQEIEIESQKSKVVETWNLWNNKYNIDQIMDITNLGKSTIMRYVKNGAKFNCCDYSVEEGNRKRIEILNQFRQTTKVICLNNNKVFNSLQEASSFYNTNASGICSNCADKRDYAGIDKKSNERLVWMYYDTYLTSTDYDIKCKIKKALHNHHKRKVICLNNLQVFESIRAAAQWCNAKDVTGIRHCIIGKANYAGTHPVTGAVLKWMDYQDYIEMKEVI